MPNRKLTVMQLGSPTGLYGAERWILALVRHLDPGRVITIVSSIKDAPGLEVPLCREAERLGVRTRIFNRPGRINFGAVTALSRYLKENRVDILHTHGYKQDLIGLLAARMAGCKVISTPHGWSRDAGLALKFYEGLNRMAFPFFDAVVPLSVELFEALKRIPAMAPRLIYIRNGVDINEINTCDRISKDLTDWKGEGRFVIGYIGQLIPRKGLLTLLSAAANLASGLKFRIAIVGEGPQRQELEVMTGKLGLSDSVCFFGFREDRLSFLRGFDLFVLPSRLEGIPRCLMEAMAAGVPVMASDLPGIRQLIGDNAYGSLFSPGNIRELAELLEEQIGAPERSASRTASAHRMIYDRFSANRMAKEYEALFEKLISGSGCKGVRTHG